MPRFDHRFSGCFDHNVVFVVEVDVVGLVVGGGAIDVVLLTVMFVAVMVVFVTVGVVFDVVIEIKGVVVDVVIEIKGVVVVVALFQQPLDGHTLNFPVRNSRSGPNSEAQTFKFPSVAHELYSMPSNMNGNMHFEHTEIQKKKN